MSGSVRRRPERTPDGRMALIEHLREFRNRLGISLLALAVAVVVALIYRARVFDFVKKPYCDTEVA